VSTGYRLYGAPGRASAAPEAVLEQLALAHGVPYEYIEVDESGRQSEDYKRINPLGVVPTFADGDNVFYEAAGICVYLADRHPEAQLAPSHGSPVRGRYYQWMFFLSNTLQPAYMLWFYPQRFCSLPDGAAPVRKDAEPRVIKAWQQLEDGIGDGPFLLGDQLTTCDIYMHMLVTWHRESIAPIASFPRVKRNFDLVEAYPGVKRMMLRNRGK
jgi:glutathione S-transferase